MIFRQDYVFKNPNHKLSPTDWELAVSQGGPARQLELNSLPDPVMFRAPIAQPKVLAKTDLHAMV